jgi:hypothetical protein
LYLSLGSRKKVGKYKVVYISSGTENLGRAL